MEQNQFTTVKTKLLLVKQIAKSCSETAQRLANDPLNMREMVELHADHCCRLSSAIEVLLEELAMEADSPLKPATAN